MRIVPQHLVTPHSTCRRSVPSVLSSVFWSIGSRPCDPFTRSISMEDLLIGADAMRDERSATCGFLRDWRWLWADWAHWLTLSRQRHPWAHWAGQHPSVRPHQWRTGRWAHHIVIRKGGTPVTQWASSWAKRSIRRCVQTSLRSSFVLLPQLGLERSFDYQTWTTLCSPSTPEHTANLSSKIVLRKGWSQISTSNDCGYPNLAGKRPEYVRMETSADSMTLGMSRLTLLFHNQSRTGDHRAEIPSDQRWCPGVIASFERG